MKENSSKLEGRAWVKKDGGRKAGGGKPRMLFSRAKEHEKNRTQAWIKAGLLDGIRKRGGKQFLQKG